MSEPLHDLVQVILPGNCKFVEHLAQAGVEREVGRLRVVQPPWPRRRHAYPRARARRTRRWSSARRWLCPHTSCSSDHVSFHIDPTPLSYNMPPGLAYNWFCVAHSVFDILSHAAQIRATQVNRAGGAVAASLPSRKRKRDESYPGNHATWEERRGSSTQPVVENSAREAQEVSGEPSSLTREVRPSHVVAVSLISSYHYERWPTLY